MHSSFLLLCKPTDLLLSSEDETKDIMGSMVCLEIFSI